MKASRRILALIGALSATVSLMLTGCAASPPASADLRAAGIEPALPDPLAAYAQPAEAITKITQAVDILTTECFTRFGMTYRSAQDYDQVRESFKIADQRLYGITDLAVADVWGYMPAPSPDPAEPWYDEIATDQYQLVLAGVVNNQRPTPEDQKLSPGTVNGQPVPAGGCLGQARVEITGTIDTAPPTGRDLAMSLHSQAWFDAWNDPSTTAAKADWAACMAAAGYNRTDPVTDDLDLSNEIGVRASSEDVAQATTDIQCKTRTDFIATANASHVAHANALIEQHRDELRPVQAFYAAASAKADRATGH
ncbi:hypothetical protein B7R21_18550 [Subtercola boreus]|uniref:DUF4439 domain-containing protein n=1 Tax=Subtercola boreus TaxID=120213 RepID=A0A3E0VAW6_9MICO|nr:hypothetical protein [Subtercola boreus]RFA06775.1 hypothetical protein B7R21_18550 [Subtercola boreus]